MTREFCLFSTNLGREMKGFINTESSEINLENSLSLMELLSNALLLVSVKKA